MRRKLGLIGKACIADDISQLKDVINSVNEQLLQTTSPSSLCFSSVFFTFSFAFDESLVVHNNTNKTNDSPIVNFMNGCTIFHAC